MKSVSKFVVLFGLLMPSVALGCSFAPDADRLQEPEDNVDKYEHIFVATVETRAELGDFVGNQYQMIVSFDVTGNTPETVIMNSPGHSCGSFFQEGAELLIFTNTLEEIDEANPQYFIQNDQQRSDLIARVQQAYKGSLNPEIQPETQEPKDEPRPEEPESEVEFAGPTGDPRIGFVEPTSPPPGQEKPSAEAPVVKTIWGYLWFGVKDTIRGLLFWTD